MNKLIISAYLAGDPETKFASSGTAVSKFSLAAESGWGDNKKTTWIECVMFGKKGTGSPHGLIQHLHKGRFVTVEGPIELQQWEHNGKGYARVSMAVD